MALYLNTLTPLSFVLNVRNDSQQNATDAPPKQLHTHVAHATVPKFGRFVADVH
jgi:hypothetical protein